MYICFSLNHADITERTNTEYLHEVNNVPVSNTDLVWTSPF